MFIFLKRSSVTFVLCLSFYYCTAQQSLSEITVTTTKLPQKSSQLAKSMVVLNDSIIKANPGWSVSELLQKQSGITIVGSGQTPGSLKSLYLRGGNVGNTLILMDGVPLYDPSRTESDFDINLINLQNIERIEILKGGQSTLYGSDAMAGVINFISRKSEIHKKANAFGKINYGSFNSSELGVGLHGIIAGVGYDVGIDHQQSRGISSAVSDFPIPEKDGFVGTNIKVSLTKKVRDLAFNIYARQANYRTDLDAGAFVEDKDYVFNSSNRQFGLSSDLVKEKYQIHLKMNSSAIERDFLDDSSYVSPASFVNYSLSTFGSKSKFIDLFSQFFFSDRFRIVLGSDFREQSIAQTYFSVGSFGPYEETPIAYSDAQMTNFSAYSAIELLASERLGMEFGGRLNSHSVYGSNFSYSLNPFYHLNSAVTFFGVYATSFKNPSLYQLYSPYGNLDLEPENSRNIDLGIKLNLAETGSQLNISWFNRKHENKVTFLNLSDYPYGKYYNIDAQQTNGLEISVNQSINSFGLNSNYTLLKGYNLNLSSDDRVYNLIRIPKHQLSFGVSYKMNEKCLLNIDYQFFSKRNDGFYDSNLFQTVNVKLKPYSLLDLTLSYKMNAKLRFFGSVFNLLNQRYTEVYGYNSKPLNFNVGLKFN